MQADVYDHPSSKALYKEQILKYNKMPKSLKGLYQLEPGETPHKCRYENCATELHLGVEIFTELCRTHLNRMLR